MRFETSRGRNFARLAIAKAATGNNPDRAIDYARSRWGRTNADAVNFVKAAVGGIESGDIAALINPEVSDFIELVRENSILRNDSFRQIPFNTRVVKMTTGTRGFWVGQRQRIPLSKPAIMGSELPRMKIATIVVATHESLEDSRLEGVIQNDMVRALAEALDEAFVDVDNAGIANDMPASITNGVSPIASTGDPIEDLKLLIAAFQGDLNSAVIASDPITLTQIALRQGSDGTFSFPDVGARGGSLLGIPVTASRSSPRNSDGGQITLFDPTGIALAFDGAEISKSDEATLVMSDDPTATSPRVSLFTTDSVALKARLYVNWEAQRTGGVAAISGANYG